MVLLQDKEPHRKFCRAVPARRKPLQGGSKSLHIDLGRTKAGRLRRQCRLQRLRTESLQVFHTIIFFSAPFTFDTHIGRKLDQAKQTLASHLFQASLLGGYCGQATDKAAVNNGDQRPYRREFYPPRVGSASGPLMLKLSILILGSLTIDNRNQHRNSQSKHETT